MIAIFLLTFIFVLVFGLGFATLARPGLVKPVAIGYLVSFIGLASYHLVLPALAGPPLPPRSTATVPGEYSATRCQEAIAQIQQAGLFIGQPRPPRVVVRAGLWNQLPQQAREAITACLESQAGGEPVTIVER